MYIFFNATPTTEIYTYLHTLSLHDALPIFIDQRPLRDLDHSYEQRPPPRPEALRCASRRSNSGLDGRPPELRPIAASDIAPPARLFFRDRKSPRLNSSH